MPWAAVAGAVVGGLIQSDSTRRASHAQQDATNAATLTQTTQADQAREDFAPWRAAGGRALGQLESDINRQPTAEEVMNTPGYQFGQQQGQQGIDRRIAAMGGRVSGASIKAAGRFNTDYATSGYNAAYQRGQDRLNRLASIAGLGQTATGTNAVVGMHGANAISGLISGQGDANAAGRIAQGNIWANTGNQLAAYYGRQQRPPPQNPYNSPNNWQQYDTADPNNSGGPY